MTKSSTRLLGLLSLLQTPREWPGTELAEHLGVTTRTIAVRPPSLVRVRGLR